MNDTLNNAARLHKALAHPARMRILAMLRSGELCVCQVTGVLDLAPSTVSAHLAALRRVGLIVERKEGRWVHVCLAETAIARRCLELVWAEIDGDGQIQRDNEKVKRIRAVPLAELCGSGGRTQNAD